MSVHFVLCLLLYLCRATKINQDSSYINIDSKIIYKANVGKDSSFINDVECGIREIALNFSQQLINRYYNRIYDALQLNQCVNSSSSLLTNKKYNKYYNNKENDINYKKYLAASTIEFYVDSNKGNDNNNGTNINNPFKTINKAKDTIKIELKQEKLLQTQSTFIVYIREGVYYEYLYFDIYDGGLSSLTPIIYKSYNNENVTISGGKKLTLNFIQTKSNPNIYTAQLSQNECNSIIFDQLFVNITTRLIRARSPNGNTETDIQPIGYAHAIGGYNGQQPFYSQPIYINSTNVMRNSSIYPWFGSDNDPRGGGIRYHIGGDAERFSDHKSFWVGTVPAGLKYNITNGELNTTNWNITDIYSPGIANVFHEALWGNWYFEINSINSIEGTIGFSRGGWQTKGGVMSSGTYNQQNPQPFYVENILQTLDNPNEWFYDIEKQILYLYPNNTDQSITNFQLNVQIPVNYEIIRMEGEYNGEISSNYVANIIFDGITFIHSLRTQLLPYEMPSGGGWTIHRGGSVYLENTQNITFKSCKWLRTGGNAIFLSNYNENITISNSDFIYLGDSAIAIVGHVDLMDGYSSHKYSNHINIISNYFEGIGVYGKQTSAVFTSIAGTVNIKNNVLHSGPRAGININDGFYGGKIIENNLIFNWVRETQDHGPINTWDRVLYVFPNNINNNATMTPQWNIISNNLIYNGPSGNRGSGNLFPTIDNDDGSRMYYMYNNVMVFGGAKNFLGTDKIWNNNLIMFPHHWPGGGLCITAWSGLNHIFMNNQCITDVLSPLGYFACDPRDFNESSKEMPFGKTNQIFVPKAKFVFLCEYEEWSLKELQQHGWEINSTVQDIPSSQQIIQMTLNKIFA